MIKKGDPAYALRNWLHRNRVHGASTWDVGMATLSTLASFLTDSKHMQVYPREEGYAIVSTVRRRREIPYTPLATVIGGRYPDGGLGAVKEG